MSKVNDHVTVIGMSGSGKSTYQVEETVNDANRNNSAIIVEDPHPESLAASTFEKLVAHGHASRILYDRLYDIDKFLGYDFLKPSEAKDPLRRRAENELRIRFFLDILLRRRGQESLAASPLTEEWVLKSLWLYVEQQPRARLNHLEHAFTPSHRQLKTFIDNCRDADRSEPFKQLYDGRVPQNQYVPAQRLLTAVCSSPAFALRCGATFDFDSFLANKGILLIEGGSFGTLSADALRIMLGAISLKVLEYVRNRPQPYPKVSHVLDEANNVALIGDHECRALAELRKNNYGCKILVQTLDFPTAAITESVLNNTATHVWFCTQSNKLAQQAAADLGDPDLKQPLRSLGVGECYIKTPGRYQHTRIQRSPDPWTFPGLSKAKAAEALKTIQKRPEYQHRTGESGTESSNDDSPRTPAPSNTSSTSSPAERLRTAASQNSANGDESGSSEA